MTKPDKTKISECFKVIENKGLGYVLTANSKKKMPIGLRGLPDHLIITTRYIVWVEVKLGSDTFSQRQLDIQKGLGHHSSLPNSRMYYYTVSSLKQAQDLTDKILSGGL